jgi:hypothetical protein
LTSGPRPPPASGPCSPSTRGPGSPSPGPRSAVCPGPGSAFRSGPGWSLGSGSVGGLDVRTGSSAGDRSRSPSAPGAGGGDASASRDPRSRSGGGGGSPRRSPGSSAGGDDAGWGVPLGRWASNRLARGRAVSFPVAPGSGGGADPGGSGGSGRSGSRRPGPGVGSVVRSTQAPSCGPPDGRRAQPIGAGALPRQPSTSWEGPIPPAAAEG